MQQLEDRGEPAWIGNCNELNASYATDGYARINGLGALIVTHGVGALSAINGIAGAYSEHVPVICISGSIPLRAIHRGDLMHHTLADREKGNFCRMFAEVTAAQAQLTPENAVAEIDRLILTAWRRKLPVYLELPSDISYLEIDVPDRPIKLEMIASDQENLKACTEMILERLNAASRVARGSFTPRPSRIRTGGSRLIRLLWSGRRSYSKLPEDEQLWIASCHPTQPMDRVGSV